MTTATESGASAHADAPEPAEPQSPDGAVRRRFPTAWVTVALVVGLLLGFGAGLLVPRLTRPGDTSVAAGFARDMVTHHSQAVGMGMIAYRSATDPAVRQVAFDIAISQQGEVGMMQAWLRNWGLNPTGSTPPMAWMPDGAASVKNGRMPGMATPEQLAQLRAATGRDVDKLFLQLMITHHLGGVHMIDAALKGTDISEVREAATTMKNVQQKELTNLLDLQKRVA